MSSRRARMYIGGESVGVALKDRRASHPQILPEGHPVEFVATPVSWEEARHNRAVDLWRAMIDAPSSLDVLIGAINNAWRDGELDQSELVGLLARVGFDLTRVILSVERVDCVCLKGNTLKITVQDEKIPGVCRDYVMAPSTQLVMQCGGHLANTPASRAASVSSGPGVSVDEADAAMAKLDEVI